MLVLALTSILVVGAVGCSSNIHQMETDLALASINTIGASGQLSTFSTKFDPASDEGRAVNIKLASNAIDRVLVKPGEEFSFNRAVGPTTAKNGYKESVIYVSGKKDKGFGGGVCQVSSTLYNAANSAGMTIVERHDHSLPVGYVEAGKDAATSYGVKDFRFVNELTYPVVIVSQVLDGKITVSVNAA